MLVVDANFNQFLRGITDLERRQVPFAISLALNTTADEIKGNTERSLMRRLDKPTPFTRRGVALRRSTKRRLEVAVYFKEKQADYLKLQETGGTRRPARRAIAVPVSQRLNRYGNIPRRTIERLLRQPDVFQGTVNGVAGIWRRPKRGVQRSGRTGTKGKRKGLKLLIAWEQSAQYAPRLRFKESAEKTTKARLQKNFAMSMRRALRSAR